MNETDKKIAEMIDHGDAFVLLAYDKDGELHRLVGGSDEQIVELLAVAAWDYGTVQSAMSGGVSDDYHPRQDADALVSKLLNDSGPHWSDGLKN